MSGMVEHLKGVARATGLDCDCWADEPLEELIRAILAGMRQPTEFMLEAGRRGKIGISPRVPYDRDAEAVWHDMIDEALEQYE